MHSEPERASRKFRVARSFTIAANENVVARAAAAAATPRPVPFGSAAAAASSTRMSAEIVAGIAASVDFLVVLTAAAIAFKAYVEYVLGRQTVSDQYALAALIGAVCFVSLMHRGNAYGQKHLTALGWQISRIAVIWCGVVATLLAAAFISKTSLSFSRAWVIGWVALTPCMLLAGRLLLAGLIRRWRESGYLQRNIVIVGATRSSAALIAKLTQNPSEGVTVVGVFDDRRDRVPTSIAGHEVLGTTDDLVDFVRRVPVDEIIVALPPAAAPRLSVLFDKFRNLPVDLRLSAEPLTSEFPMTGVTRVGDATLLEVAERPLKHWSGVAKWLEDRIVAVLGLVILAPLMGLIALLIKLDSEGPVLFVQERYGYNNGVIRVLKFRTMDVMAQDVSGGNRTRASDPRVTRIGRYLRKWSLDELPQLFNVLAGDMSIVGPRPHALAMRAGDRLYQEVVADYARRHRIKPGLTGWAQISGLRGEIDCVDKARRRVEHDIYYIEHWSLLFDLRIMLRTLLVVLDSRGVY